MSARARPPTTGRFSGCPQRQAAPTLLHRPGHLRLIVVKPALQVRVRTTTEPPAPAGAGSPGRREPLTSLLTRRHADITVAARPLTDYAHAASDTPDLKENL